MWELDHEEDWVLKNWCFWTVVLEKTLESPLDCKDIKPVNPKGHQPWIFIGLMLKLKLQYFGHMMQKKTPTHWKNPDIGKDWRQEEKGMAEDELVGWHHWLYEREFQWAPGVYPNSCPLSQCCHPTISFSAIPFSSCLQSFLALGSFQMSQFFASGGQSIRFSFNISPSNEYSGLISFRIDWFGLFAV